MPDGSVYVGRPTQWGNPFKAGEKFRDLSLYIALMGTQTEKEIAEWYANDGLDIYNARQAVEWFRKYAEWRLSVEPTWLEPLRGRDLACWCSLLGQPCHADVLLELSNFNTLKG